MKNSQKIAIIGGGFCGLAVAYNLLNLSQNPDITIDIYDEEAFQNNGKAYQTQDLQHILNVPANKMGLPEPDHFYQWLRHHQTQIYQPSSFVPRHFYCLYLQDIIKQLKQNSAINFINHKVGQIKYVNQLYVVKGDNFLAKEYDSVVLACGLKVKSLSKIVKNNTNEEFSDKIIDDVWQFFNQELKIKDGTILIVGTGLTMIDLALSLKNQGFLGEIIACSRNSRLPLPHLVGKTSEIVALKISDGNLPLSKILHKLRNATKSVEDWQRIINGLRSITSELWQQFSLSKKKQFIRHLMPFWAIHRHRVAPENYQQISQMINQRKLKIIQGKVQKIVIHNQINNQAANQQITAVLHNNKLINANLILNAMGLDFSGQNDVLLQNLLQEKIISRHQSKIGFEINKIHNNFYLTGSLLAGDLLEITAVPELSEQAKKIALKILNFTRS